MEKTPHEESIVPPTILLISTLGPLTIQHRDPQTGKVIPLSLEKLHAKGAMPALELLGLLISQPHRTANRDWILEQLWPDTKKSQAEDRMNDVSYDLRVLLRSPTHPEEKLVEYVRKTRTSGGVYHLAEYPIIWIDADAFLWYMERAALYERMNDDPLPFLERAYQLGIRGTYLVEEPYSEWAATRRKEVEGAFRLCVHTISRLYLACEPKRLMEAELIVRKYWAAHLMDEDALCLLMDILGEQQRYQDAYDCYQQTCLQLKQEGTSIDPRTHDLAEYWRTKPLSRPLKSAPQSSSVSPSPFPSWAVLRQLFLPRPSESEVHWQSDTSLALGWPRYHIMRAASRLHYRS